MYTEKGLSEAVKKKFYNSKQWLNCRKGFISMRISIDGGICEDCKREIGKIVHHKVHLNDMNVTDPDIALNYANLKYVCHNCHETVEHRTTEHIEDEIKYTFDSMGNPVPL